LTVKIKGFFRKIDKKKQSRVFVHLFIRASSTHDKGKIGKMSRFVNNGISGSQDQARAL